MNNMEELQISVENAKKFVKTQMIDGVEKDVNEAYRHLISHDGAGNDFWGWVSLPSTINTATMDMITDEAERLSVISDVVVVIGIGGSYLGARMVIDALGDELCNNKKSNHPQIIYAGHTLSEDYYFNLLKLLNEVNYSVIVISKSGTTTEPAIAFRILRKHLYEKYGEKEAVKRIVAITDSQKGALHAMAQKNGYTAYEIPSNVGGRYSVLTPVGLLPIAVAGHNIKRIVSGAQSLQHHCLSNTTAKDNLSLAYAAIRNALYRSNYKVEMLVSSLPNLRNLAEWWKQLYGESEGKDGKGILPHSITITTDLHSMGQYVQDGERMLFETVLNVRQSTNHVAIPHDPSDTDGLNYLCNKSLTEIGHCAERGTIEAHSTGGVPIIELGVNHIDEYTLGQLIYFFEFACGVSGYTLGVNPFNQPGVEAYKNNMFRLLGKPQK